MVTVIRIKRLTLAALLATILAVSASAVTVTSVTELTNELAKATTGTEIVIDSSGSPYDLSMVDCMSRVGHLYAGVKVTLRGSTGNPADVVLVGSTNRILYCQVSGNMIRDLTFKNGDCTANVSTSSNEPYESKFGGAICLRPKRDLSTISNCVFIGNHAINGGAVSSYFVSSDTETRYAGNIHECVFSNNTASTSGGAAFQAHFLRRCSFENNLAESYGGAVSRSLLTNCWFRSNSCSDNVDGGSELNTSTAVNCLFDRVGMSGKSVFQNSGLNGCRIVATNGYMFGGATGVTNCLIAGGSKFYLLYNPREGASLVNCTIVSNQYASLKAGKTCQMVTDVVNCFFYGNRFDDKKRYDVGTSADEVVREFKSCIFSHLDDYTPPGSGNLNYYNDATFNPGFVGAAKDPEHPYAIRRKSPAFHENSAAIGITGDATIWSATDTDIRGEGFLRLRDGKVDIGCYQCWLNPLGIIFSVR